MKSAKIIDNTFLYISLILLISGLLILASASSGLSESRFGTPYYYVYRQLILGVGVGVILFLIALYAPLKYLRKAAPPLLLASFILMALVFIPGIGVKIAGAQRWINLGGITFQPVEILKFALIVYIASWMTSHRKEIEDFKTGYIPFLIVTGISGLFLVLQPDIGTLGTLMISSLGLYFIGGARIAWVTLTVLLGVGLLAGLVVAAPYRAQRFMTFLNPQADRQGSGYQLNQSLIAIGSGGTFGRGWGVSRQKHQYLPEPAGDAVFSVFAEEFGFFGTAILIGLFTVFLWRGMVIAARAKDRFLQLLGMGIMLLIGVEIVVNIGALTGMLPLTGLPLPFISLGGTALALLLGKVGIILNISKA